MMIQLDSKFYDFVKAHSGDDPVKLRLRYGVDKNDEAINYALDHLVCVAKAGNKFTLADGTSWLPELMLNPLSVEQASSANVAKSRASLIDEGLRILDMTCGLGMDIRGFLTRNPVKVIGFEMNQLSADVAKVNFAKYDNVEIVEGDSVEYLKTLADNSFDLIYIDPARRDKNGGRVYNLHDCTPDLTEILPEMLKKSSVVMAKLSPMLDVTQTISDLPGICRLIAVEEKGECKELLAIIKRGFVGEPLISIGLGDNAMSFTQSDEKESLITYADPKEGMWLYVPSASAMKTGCFKLMSSRFDMSEIAPNSHLYLSDKQNDVFPGKAFKIDEVVDFASSNIKRLASRVKSGEVTVRNFSFTSAELQKKLKLKPGNGCRIFATTTSTGKKIMILTDKKSADVY
ncbi:MAG: methyltransferase domain-containing protein [Muribaculaceae bacterium]|nr:methyltransferase domain-containing protein [Muribaculaceae bacterium]